MKAYICHPLGGDVEKNLKQIDKIVQKMSKDYPEYIPVVPHYYAHSLDDSDPRQREIGLSWAMELLKSCDQIWVFASISSHNIYTPGMTLEIKAAHELGIPMQLFTNVAQWGLDDPPLSTSSSLSDIFNVTKECVKYLIDTEKRINEIEDQLLKINQRLEDK